MSDLKKDGTFREWSDSEVQADFDAAAKRPAVSEDIVHAIQDRFTTAAQGDMVIRERRGLLTKSAIQFQQALAAGVPQSLGVGQLITLHMFDPDSAACQQYLDYLRSMPQHAFGYQEAQKYITQVEQEKGPGNAGPKQGPQPS